VFVVCKLERLLKKKLIKQDEKNMFELRIFEFEKFCNVLILNFINSHLQYDSLLNLLSFSFFRMQM